MSAILRRARGVIGTALVWGTVWLVVTLPFVLGESELAEYVPPAWAIGAMLFLMAAWGAACGVLFALLVMVFERGRTWTQLRVARVAAWGASAGLAIPLSLSTAWWWLMLPVALPDALLGASVSAVMGGALAASTVLVARHTTTPDARTK